MSNRITVTTALVMAVFSILTAVTVAQELKPIVLPAPQKEGGKPLMQALNERQTNQEYSSDNLPPQVLSNLLWAAFGINRPDSGKRTAPSVMNWQKIDIYVAKGEAVELTLNGRSLGSPGRGLLRNIEITRSRVSISILMLMATPCRG